MNAVASQLWRTMNLKPAEWIGGGANAASTDKRAGLAPFASNVGDQGPEGDKLLLGSREVDPASPAGQGKCSLSKRSFMGSARSMFSASPEPLTLASPARVASSTLLG